MPGACATMHSFCRGGSVNHRPRAERQGFFANPAGADFGEQVCQIAGFAGGARSHDGDFFTPFPAWQRSENASDNNGLSRKEADGQARTSD
jgi:hypothetical protein